jgi:hypothetical protein
MRWWNSPPSIEPTASANFSKISAFFSHGQISF